MSLSAVKAALDTVKPVESSEEISTLRVERDRLRRLHERLLPFEAVATEEITAKGNELTQRIEVAETARLYEGLSVLPNSILSWTVRQKKAWRWAGIAMNPKVPAFAFIPVKGQGCSLYVSGNGGTANSLPPFVVREYVKALSDVATWCGPNQKFSWLQLDYSYAGIVPEDIRETIDVENKRDRFDSLAFICEVDRWQITGQENPPPQLLDPILVGVKNESMFVLGSFDPTPTEEYLLKEFAV